jgi:hypothetical protein
MTTENIERPTEAEYRDAEITKEDAETYEAELRYVGTAVIETDTMRPIYIRAVYQIDEDGTVHQSNHYYVADEPLESAHVADALNIEWEPTTEVGTEDFEDELLGNLTLDATAEVDAVLDRVKNSRALRRKLGVGNQGE